MRLEGKIALITGAGSGIGRAIAVAFAREGSKIALMGRRRELLEQVAHEIAGDALVIPGDVSLRENDERAVAATLEYFGGLNVLVNNGGVLHAGTAESHIEQEWDEIFAVNVKGLWMLSRTVLGPMRKAGGGSIINLSSVLGLVGARNRVAYSASKGAVTLMTKAMALDHAEEAIRVNCICPGVVDTEMVAPYIRNASDPQLALQQRIRLHPIRRLGTPEDIAECAVFLASDESSWVTGTAIPVDGGYTAV